MMTQVLEAKTSQSDQKQSNCAQSSTDREQLDLSHDAALKGIQKYYAGLINPEELERAVTIDEVEVNNNKVLISFHGWLGANRQRIRLSIDEYYRAINGDNEEEQIKSHLQQHKGILKPLSRLELKWHLYLKLSGEIPCQIALVSRDILGHWYALDPNGLTIADNLTSKFQLIRIVIAHHLDSIRREQQLAEMMAEAVMRST